MEYGKLNPVIDLLNYINDSVDSNDSAVFFRELKTFVVDWIDEKNRDSITHPIEKYEEEILGYLKLIGSK